MNPEMTNLTLNEQLLIHASNWLRGTSPRIWPGWEASRTPVAIYTPEEHVWLVNHPAAPAGFRQVDTVHGKLHYYRGNHPLVRANTAADIGGVQVACLQATTEYPREYSIPAYIGLVVHEVFHAYQLSGNYELSFDMAALHEYPHDDPVNNALCRVENAVLCPINWLHPGSVEQTVLQDYLAVRRERHSRLPTDIAVLEITLERFEGVAQYTALHVATALARGELTPGAAFAGLVSENALEQDASLSEQARAFVRAWAATMDQSTVRDPGEFWVRVLALGGLKGLVLDKLVPGWKVRVQGGVGLDALLDEVLGPGAVDMPQLLSEHRYEEYLTEEEEHRREVEKHRQELLRRFDPATQPLLIFEFGENPMSRDIQWDPTNRVTYPNACHIHTRMFSYITAHVIVDSHAVPPIPVMEDRQAKRLVVPLPSDLELEPGQTEIDYSSRGLRVYCSRCRVRFDGPAVYADIAVG